LLAYYRKREPHDFNRGSMSDRLLNNPAEK